MSSNLFSAFRRLLPKQPVLIGVVVSTGSGSSLVEMPGAERVTVRGEATVGSSVFIRHGAIEGTAPSLPLVLVEV